ncbi:MAG: hypothetical protein K8I29_15340 [Alphaproteobacteria bacterium]|uniref:Uncharacterized protein n=1 Tax=Candidatus Nitrobium versatile TaxID=2884831 RepID=A0A953JAJ6_9BACT|nr:hypothetical protein [Candidatus Nitrobium versatile]
MGASKTVDQQIINKEAIISKIRDIIRQYKNIAVSGEEGVGKITNTLEALQDTPHVYYIGNPVDYIGKPRAKGYDKYIHYIMSLKKDMHIIADEEEIVSFDPAPLAGKDTVLVVDEIYGRSDQQYEKILEILGTENIKVFIIAGCLKNISRIVHKIDIVLMLTKDGGLVVESEFIRKVCTILKADAS